MQTLIGNVAGIPFTLVTLIAFGAVIRRLLGVRLGFVRTALGALLALILAGLLMQALLPEPDDSPTSTVLLYLALCVSSASLLAMVVLVIGEVLVPEGSVPGPLELWRGWRSRVARTRRYSQILAIALRHGLGRFLRGRRHPGLESSSSRRMLARSVRRALDEGGVTFVKLGQQLSTRRDLLPPEFVEELATLQDQAAPVPWPEIEALLEAELGRPLDESFTSINCEPMAAASIAQVHEARLPEGKDVVVKVQRPGAAQVVNRDLDILRRLARTLEGRTEWGSALGLQSLADGFGDALREELDFTIERDNLRAVAASTSHTSASDSRIRVPAPHVATSTARVLVMERLDGTPLGSAHSLLASMGAEGRQQIATSLLESVMEQVLVHGLFHVDLHPGNVLLEPDGTLGLLDLGSVGRIDGTTRLALGKLMVAMGRADSLAATDALLELVDRPDELSERELERAVGAFLVRYTSGGSDLGGAMFTALFGLITSYRLGVPPQVAAVFRTFATLEGTLAIIDPDFELVARAREAGREQVRSAMQPDQIRTTLEDELASLLPVLRRLPRRIDRIADTVEQGRLTLNLRPFADQRDRRLITDLLHQALLTVLAAAAGVMAVLLFAIDNGPRVTAGVTLFGMLGTALLIVSVVLGLRVLVLIFRHDLEQS